MSCPILCLLTFFISSHISCDIVFIPHTVSLFLLSLGGPPLVVKTCAGGVCGGTSGCNCDPSSSTPCCSSSGYCGASGEVLTRRRLSVFRAVIVFLACCHIWTFPHPFLCPCSCSLALTLIPTALLSSHAPLLCYSAPKTFPSTHMLSFRHSLTHNVILSRRRQLQMHRVHRLSHIQRMSCFHRPHVHAVKHRFRVQ